MITLDVILKHYKKDWESPLDDRFGARLTEFLTAPECKKIGFPLKPEYASKHKPKKWTRRNILKQLKDDCVFGYEKARWQRGISSALMSCVVVRWNRILQDGLEDMDEDGGGPYHVNNFLVTAKKYGWLDDVISGRDNG